MYQYTDFDRQFVSQRASQYRDQLQRHLRGELSEDDFRPLRLQNGWYVQRYAPMLRVAVPYGELASRQLRALARIAREFDQPAADVYAAANSKQGKLGSAPLTTGVGHFSTRQNVQFNWIALERSADVMELLASVDMHGIQTSGNCIRNITSDALAGVAADETIDPRPYCEIIRQWSTLHPEFAFLPRKFKIAVTGSREDRVACAWHDIGLQLHVDAGAGVGFKVLVGGGMGRTPLIASTLREFLPWNQILNYLEAVLRVFNRFGRRDNLYKARLKILVKAEGELFRNEVEAEYRHIREHDGAAHTIPVAELERVSASFVAPAAQRRPALQRHVPEVAAADAGAYQRWLSANVQAHKNPVLRAVTLSFKRPGFSPGDASAEQLDAAADLAERFSASEVRVTHQQNLLLPWVHADDLPELWRLARALGLARANIGLLTDMIACPGGDFCGLANARSIALTQAIQQRFDDLDELFDLGAIDLHISGCINSCGHHHTGHIGILGVDKAGREWYQVSLGGSDGSQLSGAATPGKVIGPSFAAAEVVDVVEAVLDTYRAQRQGRERFLVTLRRVGLEPFRQAADRVRCETRQSQGEPVSAPVTGFLESLVSV